MHKSLFLLTTLLLLSCSKPDRRSLLVNDDGCVCICQDAGTHADADIDAPVDAVIDATVDAEIDASPDADIDAPVDAEIDAPIDATVDAPIDAPPVVIDLATPWVRTTITQGTPTGAFRGADGVAKDAEGCWVTPYEEGRAVSRACLVAGIWQTELVATGLTAVEAAAPGDFDGDGIIDVVSCGGSCQITFRGSPNVTMALPTTTGHANMIATATMDVNNDGLLDIVVGSYAGSLAQPAVLGWLGNPGILARTHGNFWLFHLIDKDVGYVMSILPQANGRIVVSDRTYYYCPAGHVPTCTVGARMFNHVGVRWLVQTSPDVWESHHIGPPAGTCLPSQPLCTNRTPSDVMFAVVDGNDVWSCSSSSSAAYSWIARHRTTDWISWTTTVLPVAANVGHCQSVVPIPGGVAVSTWKNNNTPMAPSIGGVSGVYWMRDDGNGVWSRGEISGPGGCKFDNIARLSDDQTDVSLITSEQLGDNCVAGNGVGGLGVVKYNPF